MQNPTAILITGASSGIGEALARAYAGRGRTLFLSGRDPKRLGAVVEACRRRGATVTGETVDVADRDAMAAWIASAHAQAPLDLVVANAGISAGSSGQGESAEQARDIFATNLAGVLNTVHPAMAAMRSSVMPPERPRARVSRNRPISRKNTIITTESK